MFLRSNSYGLSLWGASLYLCISCGLYILPFVSTAYDEKRLLEFALLLIAAIICVVPAIRNNLLQTISNLAPIARQPIALVIAIGLASSTQAPIPRYAFIEVLLFSTLTIFSLYIATAVRKGAKDADNLLIWMIWISAVLYLVRFFTGYVTGQITGVLLSSPNIFPGFSHIRFFTQYQTWTLPLLTLPIASWRSKHVASRVGAWTVFSLWWALLWLSGTRGTLAGLSVAAICVALLYGRSGIRWARCQLIAAGIGFAAYLLLFTDISRQLALERGISLNGRGELWRLAWEFIQAHPLLGIGPMHYAYFPNPIAAHPHNSLLQIACEWGIPAALIVLYVFCRGSFKWVMHCRNSLLLNSRSRENNDAKAEQTFAGELKVALTAAFLAGAAHSLVSGIIVMPLSQIAMVIVIGWMIGIYQREQAGPTLAASRRSYFVGGIAIIAIVAGLAVSVAPDIPNVNKRISVYQASHANSFLKPRLWQQGVISK